MRGVRPAPPLIVTPGDERFALAAIVSSNISAIGYEAATKTLRVKFNSGTTFDYSDVPAELHARLMKAPSAGSFLAREIKPLFKAAQVQSAPSQSEPAPAV